VTSEVDTAARLRDRRPAGARLRRVGSPVFGEAMTVVLARVDDGSVHTVMRKPRMAVPR
jgi:hypothetical protein